MANYMGGAVNPDTPPLDNIQPAASKDYLMFGNPDAGFQSGMSAEDQASWNAIGKKYAAGDKSWNSDTDSFREDGNWSSFYDADGNINGWLYAGNGMGGYAPVFGGKVGETGYKPGTVFFSPDGKAYTMGDDGSLSQSGNVEWARYGSYVGPKTGYQDSSFWALDENGNYKKYTNQTAPDSVLEAQGYFRDDSGLVRPINNDYYIAKGIQNGQITPEQAELAKKVSGTLRTPNGSTKVRDALNGVPNGGSVYPSGGGSGNTYPSGGNGGGNSYPSGGGSYPFSEGAPRNAFQSYLDQWDYGEAPEWEGSPYKEKRDKSLEEAQNMQYADDEYRKKRDELTEQSLQAYGGSQYDPLRDEYLQRYGEEWDGSDYQQKRDEHLQNAENMKFNYNPETDPVWQALQKQYRREGDRATRQTMGLAAAMTGGVPSSYAATAAAMAGNNYAAQLSDRLPQVYQDAYNRYLQEFQQQMGISDQYAGFDDREYSRWADQQGKNLDLADRYNQYGQQDYGQYMDRVNQQLSGADRYNAYDQNEYQRYLDEYGRKLDAADAYNKFDQTEYERSQDRLGQYNKDREFEYGRYRDAVEEARFDDETAYNRAWNEENRDYTRNYQAQRDAILDNRADREWAQQLREYADGQREFDSAMRRLQVFGYVRAEDADTLGAPAGTSLEDYISGSGSGRRSTGNTKTAASRKDAAESSDTRDFSTHPDGRKRTAGYGELKTLMRNALVGGSASLKQLSRMIDEWAARGRIEDYEAGILRREFGLDSGSRRLAPR